MSLQNRLDNIERAIKPLPQPNPFADMTKQELDKLTVELGELVQAKYDKTPNSIASIDHNLIEMLKSKGLLAL